MNFNSEDIAEEGSGTVFRDVITILMLSLVAVIIMMLPYLNEPTEQKEEIVQFERGIVFRTNWEEGLDVDVDTHIKQADGRVINYTSRNSRIFDLLEDDLGNAGDIASSNGEFAFAPVLPAGHYIFNVRLYSNRSHITPVAVYASLELLGEEQTTILYSDTIYFNRIGEMITVISFDVDEEGVIYNIDTTTQILNLRPATSGGSIP